MPKSSNGGEQGHNFWDLALNGLDDTVTPAIVSFGQLGKDIGGTWRYRLVASDGAAVVESPDAGLMRVSSVGSAGTVTLSADASGNRVSAFSNDAGLMRVSAVGGTNSPLSADSSSISAKQGDAVNLNISAKSLDAGTLLVSAKSGDAGLFRVSSLGGTSSPLSADSSSISAKQGDAVNLNISAKSLDAGTLLISAKQGDAGLLRISAIGGTAGDRTLVDGTTQTISATLTPVSAKAGTTVQGLVVNINSYDAGQTHVSAYAPDAGLFRVSAIGGTAGDHTLVDGTTQTISATLTPTSAKPGTTIQGLVINANLTDANQMHVSATQLDAGLLRASALNQDANFMHVSGFSPDASLFRVSTIASTVSAFINQGTVSAYSPDAALFRISAINSISALSPDAGLFRVSAQNFDRTTSAFMTAIGDQLSASAMGIGNLMAQLSGTWTGTIGFQATIDESNWFAWQGIDTLANTIISSTTTSRNISFETAGLRRFRLSATAAMTGTLSAFIDATATGGDSFVALKQDDASYARVSAIAGDAAIFRISAIGGDANTLHTSAVQGDAGLLHVSTVGTILVSAHEVKQSDAAALLISAKSGDANQVHVSATQLDAGLLLVSAKQGSADLLRSSATQTDAGLLHVSASIFPDTTGGLSMFSNFNVSTSQNIKATAGAVYGWYAWNNDSKPNWVNLYNTSGAINVGTDAIKLQIYLPASAAANVFSPIGLLGFTNGISVASVSAAVSTATTPGAASAIGLNLFYK